jgi:hypothetical protein
MTCVQKLNFPRLARLNSSSLSLIVPHFFQIYLFFEKSLFQDRKLRFGTTFLAIRLMAFCILKGCQYFVTGIIATFTAIFYFSTGRTGNNFMSTPGVRGATPTADLIIGDHLIAIAELIPQFRRRR